MVPDTATHTLQEITLHFYLCRLFYTGCIYGCKNDAERFGFFCHAALEYLLQSGSHPVSYSSSNCLLRSSYVLAIY